MGAVSVNVNVDPFKSFDLLKSIAEDLHSNQNREGFVKGLRDEYFYKHDSKYNVMVFNLAVKHTHNLKGIKGYATVTAYFPWVGNITYGIWIFDKGTFTNQGDGGYINWAFRGAWEREPNSGYVRFK